MSSNNQLLGSPKTLEECFAYLDQSLNEETKNEIRQLSEVEVISNLHFTLGMKIRNEWGLWGEGELKQYFESKGIMHPDDMSTVILTSYIEYLNGKS
jgi:hypothetical protein